MPAIWNRWARLDGRPISFCTKSSQTRPRPPNLLVSDEIKVSQTDEIKVSDMSDSFISSRRRPTSVNFCQSRVPPPACPEPVEGNQLEGGATRVPGQESFGLLPFVTLCYPHPVQRSKNEASRLR